MNIFTAVWDNWSIYQKVTTALLYTLLLILIPLLVTSITKSKQFTIFSVISLISSAIITLISFIILNIAIGQAISFIYQLTPIIVLIINILNISTSIGFFEKQKKDKELNIINLKKEYLKDTLQLTIFLTLMFSAFSAFLSGIIFTFIVLTGVIAVIVPWVNFAIVYWYFKKNA